MWFISPEFDLQSISEVAEQMKPALQLFYVHNGHMPEQDFNQLRALSPDLPLVGMAPHVATYVTNRLGQPSQEQQLSTATAPAAAQAAKAEWLLPIWPFLPQQPCSLVRLPLMILPLPSTILGPSALQSCCSSQAGNCLVSYDVLLRNPTSSNLWACAHGDPTTSKLVITRHGYKMCQQQ